MLSAPDVVVAVNNFGDTRSGGLAGPMGLFIILLLTIATVLLVRNMNARLRRLPDSFPDPAADRRAAEVARLEAELRGPAAEPPAATPPAADPAEPSAADPAEPSAAGIVMVDTTPGAGPRAPAATTPDDTATITSDRAEVIAETSGRHDRK